MPMFHIHRSIVADVLGRRWVFYARTGDDEIEGRAWTRRGAQRRLNRAMKRQQQEVS